MSTFEPIESILKLALNEAMGSKTDAIAPLHLLIAVLKFEAQALIERLKALNLDLVQLRRRLRYLAHARGGDQGDRPVRVSSRVRRILSAANLRAEARARSVTAEDLLVATLENPDQTLSEVLESEQFPSQAMLAQLNERARTDGRPPTPVLDRLGRDYTEMARAGKLEPVIGRREEIKQVVRILLRKEKNTPVLLGEPGVGKTRMVEGLALLATGEKASAEIKGLRIVELPIAALVANTKHRGEFEAQLESILKEAESDPGLVLFLDEIHRLVGAGGAENQHDAATILKPALARGGFRCIGATTPADYARVIEKDAALERRFQPVHVAEPSLEQAREILTGMRASYETFHQVSITDEAIQAAVELSVRYLPDLRLPDKALDLIDEAAVNVRVLSLSAGETVGPEPPCVDREAIARAVSRRTGVPLGRLTVDQKQRLLGMEAELRRQVLGQDEAVKAVAEVVRQSFAGLSRPGRPCGVFLFVGPTGVGKTELARALARFLFDDDKHLLAFDMSEYQEKHSVSRLIGAPPGYVGHEAGGRLTDSVRRTPYSVVLFDEVEKAHPEVIDLCLQIFDEGRLTDARGRQADFSNTLIILTSNLGSANLARRPLGFRQTGEEKVEEALPEAVKQALRGHFRPELLNRLSRIVCFQPLRDEHVRGIVDKLLERAQERLAPLRIRLEMTQAAYDVLLRIGFRPDSGAREMDRLIERQVLQPLATRILEGNCEQGSTLYVVAQEDGTGVGLALEAPIMGPVDPTG